MIGLHMPAVVSLSDPSARDPALVGGKAARLAQLSAARLPVPAGFVVPLPVFSTVVAPRVAVPAPDPGSWR